MEKKIRNRFKVKKMFSSLLLSYGVLLMVPFFVVFILIAFWETSTKNYYMEIVKSGLTEGRMQFEKRLDVMKAGAFSVGNDSELSWVYYLEGLNEADSNITTLMRCNEMLKQTFSDSDKYYNYCVVLRNGFVFRKKGMTTGREFFYEKYRSYENMTYEEWLEKSFQAASWGFYPLQRVTTDESTEEAMTFSYPIRGGFSREGEAKAVVQFLLPRQDLEEMFPGLMEMQGIVTVFASDGTRLADISMQEEKESLDFSQLPKEDSCEIKTWNGTEKMVACQKSEDGNLVFAVMLPSEIGMMGFKQTCRIAFFLLLISFLFEIALGFRFAVRYSMPIRNVVENMQRMFAAETQSQKASGQETISEYEYLEQGVNALLDTNQSMKTILLEKEVKEKQNFMTLLLNGEFHSEQEILEEASRLGIDLTAEAHYAAVLYTETAKEALAEAIEQTACRYGAEYHILNENKIALLFPCTEGAEAEQTVENCRRFLKELQQLDIKGIFCGVGSIYRERNEIPSSFRQAYYCADKAVREQLPDSVVEYTKELLKLNMPWYPAEIEEKLVNAVRSGNTELITSLFKRLREENLEKVHLSKTIGKMLVSNVAVTLLRLYNSMAENENITEIIERIEKEETLEAAFPLLEEQFLNLGGRIEETRSRKSETYYLQLKEYMEKNYQEVQLGVPMAAAAFGLSESYFSLFFKETMGKSFSSYLETIRLEKAKELIAGTDYDLEKISGMVGYSSSATFRRAFKRAYGVAPSAWRE